MRKWLLPLKAPEILDDPSHHTDYDESLDDQICGGDYFSLNTQSNMHFWIPQAKSSLMNMTTAIIVIMVGWLFQLMLSCRLTVDIFWLGFQG